MKHKLLQIQAFGNSMYPFFKSGDILFVQPAPLHTLQVNDFITFQKNHVFITHRVIYLSPSKKYLLAKGDRNLEADGKIKPEQIIGKVVKIKRNGKTYTPDTIYQLQSFLYTQEIQKINALFQKHKIDYVFLKGLPLHLYYEKEIPKKIYADCDILIKKTQLQLVEHLLKKQGYVKQDKAYSFIHKLLKDKETEIDFIKQIHGFKIDFDIHVEASFMMHQIGTLEALYPQKLLDQFTQDLLIQKRWIKTEDKNTYPILSPIHSIIYLALHLFHHNFQGYYRFEFLNTVLRKEKIHVKKLIDCLQIYKLQTFVTPVFLLLEKYYKNQKAKQILDTTNITRNKLKKVQDQIQKTDIFADDSRMEGGIKRFYLLFIYSPRSIFKRFGVLASPAILYSLLWVGIKRLEYYKLYINKRLTTFGSRT